MASERLRGVMALFEDADSLRHATVSVRSAGFRNETAFLPVPDDTALEVVEPGSSPVRWAALLGGVTGITLAIVMTVICSWDYPLIVGGKSLTSWPPFLVICFEMMVLFGAFGGLAGFLLFGNLPHGVPTEGYDPRFAVDRFGLYVPFTSPSALFQVRSLFEASGANEVWAVYREGRRRIGGHG